MASLSRPGATLACLMPALVVVGCQSCASRQQSPASIHEAKEVASTPDIKPPKPPPGRRPAGESAGGVAAMAAQPSGPSAGLQQQLAAVAGGCTGARPNVAAVICVDDDGRAKPQRGTASAPFSSIRAALRVAKKGDTLRVAGGTYRENVAIGRPAIQLLGGFAGDFASRQPATHVATIQGVGRDAAVVIDGGGATVVDGFRVTGGTGNERQKRWFYRGGGFFVSGGSPTISHNLIERNDIVSSHPHNDDENQGAGIFAQDAKIRIIGNVVRNNKTSRGVIAVAGCRARIQGNSVTDNLAIGDHGGGLYLAGPLIEVFDNYVARNRLVPKQGHGGWGGGILVLNKGTRAQLRGNTITDNHAPANGSGVFIDDGAVAELRNELIVNNGCPEAGGAGLYVDGLDRRVISRATVINSTIAGNHCPGKRGSALFLERAQVTVKDSILWGNGGDDLFADRWSKLKVSTSITQEKTAGEGNKTTDPLFADPQRGDFHLRSRGGRWHRASARWVKDDVDSPAIDAGDPKSGTGEEPAPNGGRRNLGAYGGTAQASLTK